MGKTTLYHPISLHVIRGAAEWCGWKFSTLKQKRFNRELNEATYIVGIDVMPGNLRGKTVARVHNSLQLCFMRDIQVTQVWQTKSGRWFAQIDVTLRHEQSGLEEEEARDLRRQMGTLDD